MAVSTGSCRQMEYRHPDQAAGLAPPKQKVDTDQRACGVNKTEQQRAWAKEPKQMKGWRRQGQNQHGNERQRVFCLSENDIDFR